MTEQNTPIGAGFLTQQVGQERIFTPEDFTADQRAFAQTIARFIESEVETQDEALDHPDAEFSAMVGLLKRAGELGLLMIDIPEAYGGLGLDKTTSMLCTEVSSGQASFSVSYSAHTGIGTLPLVFFGTPEQKAAWLPSLASGERIAAYALTEPGSGSDAMAAKTTAKLNEAGTHYVVNGSKMWITNARFADLLTVFVQVDGAKFSALLIPTDTPGVEVSAEERKMGLKGSSTCLINFTDVHVPVENLLGEVGRGHKIAFNILNIGRFKLGVGCVGAGKKSIRSALKYAAERKQFGQSLDRFGAIRDKVARMVAKTFALESMSYRVAGYMDASIDLLDPNAPSYNDDVMRAIEEFAVEDSIMKVFGTEVFDFVADETLQIYGGYGFSEEYPAARVYRDARVNRIFEGTNEINRMLIPGTVLKRVMKGKLPLFAAIQQLEGTLSGDRAELPEATADAPLAPEVFLAQKLKELTLFVSNKAIQRHMADLKDQQEILMEIADMMIFTYALDSTFARVLQHIDQGGAKVALMQDAARVLLAEANGELLRRAETLLNHLAAGDAGKRGRYMNLLDRFTYRPGIDVIGCHRRLAEASVELGRYPL